MHTEGFKGSHYLLLTTYDLLLTTYYGLLLTSRMQRLSVCYFPNTAFLGCCDRGLRSRCFKHACLEAIAPVDNVTVSRGKYQDELTSALRNQVVSSK